jgi:K+-sensing histidine kinase KdpD
MRQYEPGLLPGYGCAVVSVVLAAAARMLLQPSVGEHHAFATFYLAVAFTAWYAGLGPALASLVLGSLLAVYFILPPAIAWGATTVEHAVGLGLYLFVGLSLTLLSESLRQARRRATESAQDAQDRQQELEREMREHERTEAALRSSEQTLTEANQRKDEFLALLGHELRTPLSATTTTLRLLRQLVCGDQKLQQLIDRSERQTRRMGRLIDDLQDMARISRGTMLPADYPW